MGAPTSACHPKTLPRPRVLESKIVFEFVFRALSFIHNLAADVHVRMSSCHMCMCNENIG